MSTAIQDLLDAAKKKTSSDYKTAKLLGITPARLGDWRAGRQNAQPEDHALIAELAGMDAEEALIRAVLAKHAETAKGEKLLSALGKGLHRITEVATLLIFASAGFLFPSKDAQAHTARLTPTIDNV